MAELKQSLLNWREWDPTRFQLYGKKYGLAYAKLEKWIDGFGFRYDQRESFHDGNRIISCCTGKLAVDERPIWAGDIISAVDGFGERIGVVTYSPLYGCFYLEGFDGIFDQPLYQQKNISVLGNIWENTDLLPVAYYDDFNQEKMHSEIFNFQFQPLEFRVTHLQRKFTTKRSESADLTYYKFGRFGDASALYTIEVNTGCLTIDGKQIYQSDQVEGYYHNQHTKKDQPIKGRVSYNTSLAAFVVRPLESSRVVMLHTIEKCQLCPDSALIKTRASRK